MRGCLLGGALGDALGAPVEFDSIDRIRTEYGPEGLTGLVPDPHGEIGLITDDTQMTLFTVEGLLRGGDVTAVHHAYLRWLDTQQHPSPVAATGAFRTGRLREQRWLYSRRAPGNACLSGLRHRGTLVPAPPGLPGPVNPGSKGCGTVMRSAPFGLRAPSPRHAFELAAACAQTTHGHPTGALAAGALAALVHFLVGGGPLDEAVRRSMALLAAYPSHEETSQALEAAVSLAAEGGPSPEKVESLGGAWVAEEALAIAVYCALTHPEPDGFRAALLLAVNHSGDSDSTGAVCGNLLGTLHGEAVLPRDWLRHLEGREAIAELADDFAAQPDGDR
ncbi:ADP-ribosylglycohydrolase [Streptosporangium becharense]|uniref:ADP-ribosylglycohydrolase n=1 Tax=Streptosporangium becharense TaxID=1816182 RepID=A0A7W9MIK1_9ACTN|nr:ADP-ribosylglycohydrolase family protein [Streptosporangium becharense]MBB2911231.1 ADP-ribosylglycohydrolase [Streptosporangium becharense]MBB5821711.1 ADP-ribosylglycohydrolase [Streptosporangium becharense]